MANIPIASVPRVQRTGVKPLRVSSRALGARGRAFGQAGQLVGQVSKQVERLGQQKRLAEDIAAIADADRIMKTSSAEYQTKISQEGDETKWLDTWGSQKKKTRNAILNQPLRPEVKRQLEIQLDNWETDGDIKAGGQVEIRGIQRSKAKILTAAELDLENGDIEAYKEKIAALVAGRMMDPDDAPAAIAKGERIVDNLLVKGDILEDPRGTREILEKVISGELKGQANPYLNLSPEQLTAALNNARKEETQQRTKLIDGFMLAAAANDNPELFVGQDIKSDTVLWAEATIKHANKDLTDGQLISLRNTLFDSGSKQANVPVSSQIRKDIAKANFGILSQNDSIDLFGEIEGRIIESNLPNEARLLKELQDKRDRKGVYSNSASSIKITELEKHTTELFDQTKFFRSAPFFKEGEFDDDNPEHIEREWQSYTDTLDSIRAVHDKDGDKTQSEIWDLVMNRPGRPDNVKRAVGSLVSFENKSREGRGISLRDENLQGEDVMRQAIEQIIREKGGEVDFREFFKVEPVLPSPKPKVSGRTRGRG